VQPEEYLAKYAADRVRTTASVWLGITLGCAECHDHKFDPFNIEDFYNFGSFFADIKERGLYSGANSTGNWGPSIDVPDPQLPGLLKPIDAKIDALTKSMQSRANQLVDQQRAWEQTIRSKIANWQTLKPANVLTYHETPHKVLADDSILLQGKPTDEDAYAINIQLDESTINGIRLEVLPDNSLPRKGPGRAGNGNFVVTQLIAARGNHREMEVLKKVFNLWPENLQKQTLPLANASATIEQASNDKNHPYKKWSAGSAIDQDKHGPTWGWAILPESGKPNELVVQIPGGAKFEQGQWLTIVLHQYHGHGNHILGRFRISVSSDANPVADPYRSLPADIRAIIKSDPEKRNAQQTKKLADYYLSVAPQFESERKQIAQLKKEREALVKKHTRTSLVTVAVKPREMRVLARGNWMDKTGKLAQPKTPATLPPLAVTKGRPTRTELAEWIVHPDNPLTARAFVNRLWKLYFGQGIARVLDDLGSQGGWPSHPELLDYLAIEFVESGWDIKHVIRKMVTSAAYRQSSQTRADLVDIDPENNLFARQARYRLDAEVIRDNALATSGLLVKKIGGRSVKPYQPPGLLRHLNFPKRSYKPDDGESQFRRGLYTHWQRQFLHPAMKTFDAPAREECTCERPKSNTPLSALVLLNDPSFVEAARNLAQRAFQSNDNDHQRIKSMFRQALSREPSAQETQVLMDLLRQHEKHFATHPTEASDLITIGISKTDTGIPTAKLAALTNVARTIFNLHEFITRN
jgi:hypothetical protein